MAVIRECRVTCNAGSERESRAAMNLPSSVPLMRRYCHGQPRLRRRVIFLEGGEQRPCALSEAKKAE